MKLIYTSINDEYEISDEPLSSVAQAQILSSGNAMRGFIYNATQLPPASYLRCWSHSNGLEGAVLLEPAILSTDQVSIHPLILERNPTKFQIYVELSLIYCILKQLRPYSTVLNDPAYAYMNKFIESIGGVLEPGYPFNIYRPPVDWTPRLVTTYKVET